MGAVYEAEHERIGKRVAIKVVTTSLSRDPSLSARLEREARAAAATGHRGVIDIYDVGEDTDGALFLVMELLQGESLGQLVSRSGPLHVPFVAGVALQILSALEAVHERGILHRDLKPDNVFLVPSGGPIPDVKLLDFGLSKGAAGLEHDRITTTGTIMGTPAYMAPEQLLGHADLDRRVDVYAMGVMLYECLTGVLPFDGETVHSLVDKALHDPVRPPHELRADLPAELVPVVLQALSRKREQRTESALAMARALVPFADREQVRRAFPSTIIAAPPLDLDPSAPTVPESQTLKAAVRAASVSATRNWSWRRKALVAAGTLGAALAAVAAVSLLGPDAGQARGPAAGRPAANEAVSAPSDGSRARLPAPGTIGRDAGAGAPDGGPATGLDGGLASFADGAAAVGDAGPQTDPPRDTRAKGRPRTPAGSGPGRDSSPSTDPRAAGAQGDPPDIFGFEPRFTPRLGSQK